MYPQLHLLHMGSTKFLVVLLFASYVGEGLFFSEAPSLAHASLIPCSPPRYTVGPPSAPPPPNTFVFVANGNFQYEVNNVVNPTITLTRGVTYTFDLTAITDEHPFVINNQPVFPFAPYILDPAYGQLVTFTPTAAMPNTIHYHCTVHYGSMSGTINLVNCPGDLNATGAVNTADFGIFVNAFGNACTGCTSDLNNDGQVNTADFGLFVNSFGTAC